jgi:asparagine synthase (glutamine-hydrolysing)
MCGFVGILSKNPGDFQPEILKKMAETIHYRGPDDEGSYFDKVLGLFHKRLSIIDLQTGHQPMVSGEIVIVYNGEIYNYIELRENLRVKGYQFQTESDTEVIIRMYEAFGVDAFIQMNGMFSCIIYDKYKNKLIVVRDHFGIKPLYFYHDKEKFIFASEIKAILAFPGIIAEVQEESLHEYLTFQFLLSSSTLFKNIFKLEPGHYMVVDTNTHEVEKRKYWALDFSTDLYYTEEYYIAELRRLIEDTIKIQLRSDVPLGTYLSGGLDSSIVSLIVSKLLPYQLKTFTGAFHEGPEYDETLYSRTVAELSGAESHEVFPSVSDFIDVIPKLIYHLDEPVAGPGAFPQFMVSKLASKHVKVILGGQGGDEVFGGYARYVVAYLEQAIKGAIYETTEEGEHIVSLSSILPNLPYLKQYVPMMKKLWEKDLFEPMDARYFYLIDRLNVYLEYFTKEFIERYDRVRIFERFRELFNNPNTHSYYNKMTHFDMFASLPGLLQVEDRVSMAVSIESRVPLLDRRIVDLIIKMPPSMKFKGAEMKYILKRSMKDVIPDIVAKRKDKMGFPVPLHLWMKNGARDFVQDTLLSKKSKARGIWNTALIEKMIEAERPFGRHLWSMLCLELWFREFIDR